MNNESNAFSYYKVIQLKSYIKLLWFCNWLLNCNSRNSHTPHYLIELIKNSIEKNPS